MNTKMKMFKIHADYRNNNPHINWYYVYAYTKKDARVRFKSVISWLDIYKVEDCTDEEKQRVVDNPDKYILI